MAGRGRHRRGGRATPKGTRPHVARGSAPLSVRESGDLELMVDVRRALSDEHPLGLLALASTLLEVADPRGRNPFSAPRGAPEGPSAEELVGSFVAVDRRETTALLAAIAQMARDEVLRARARREVQARRRPLPEWLERLGQARPYRTVEMSHVLGDGDNVVVAVRLPGDYELSVVVYIDHNMGTLVKDAFVIPEALDEVLEVMQSKAGNDPDMTWRHLDPADAKARITEAVARGAITLPPFETDTWPACRPLVEWVARLLPDGGTGYQRPEWDEQATRSLAERFWGSPFAADLDRRRHAELLDDVLWFGTDYGPGDPMRWSPVAVEILLGDWIPRKIVAPVSHLALAPDLLRAFIRFCHHERGIRPALTEETLEALDRWAPEYQRTIRSPRPQGPLALLAAVGAIEPQGPWDDPFDEPFDFREVMREGLRGAVGGEEALGHLDDRPLPDEDFRWDGVPEDVHSAVREVLELCDRCCDELLDAEYRTACRRLLHRVAVGDPSVFRRRGRTDTAAAAVCWTVGKANELFRQSGGGVLVKDLMAHFGLQQGSVSQRASTLLRAAGVSSRWYGDIQLGSPEYLVSARRRRLTERRDCLEALDAE